LSWRWRSRAWLLVEAGGAAARFTRQFRQLNLNISGSEGLGGQSEPIASFLQERAALDSANVITLQEVCGTQHNAILAALRQNNPFWNGSWKSFGKKDGCTNERHGLSIFTLGPHSDLWWRYLDTTTDKDGDRWWGMMRVSYLGVHLYNTHVRSASRTAHVPLVYAYAQQSPLFILAGDFNSTPDDPLMDDFYSEWFEADYPDNEYTIGPRTCDGIWDLICLSKRRKIDYIWTNRRPLSVWGDALHSPSNHRLVRGRIKHWF
jgi:hypothetical protein